jgi:hypothetical protein
LEEMKIEELVGSL